MEGVPLKRRPTSPETSHEPHLGFSLKKKSQMQIIFFASFRFHLKNTDTVKCPQPHISSNLEDRNGISLDRTTYSENDTLDDPISLAL